MTTPMTDEECFDKLCETGIPRTLWENFSLEVRQGIRESFEKTIRPFTPEEDAAFRKIENKWIGVPGTDGNETVEPPAVDDVNHPAGYTQGAIECIDALRSMLTSEEYRGGCKMQAVQYIWREKFKEGNKGLRKAIWYLNKAIDADEQEKAK